MIGPPRATAMTGLEVTFLLDSGMRASRTAWVPTMPKAIQG